MMSNQKGFSIFVLATVAVLNCGSFVSGLSIHPRISRTSDSIIIDFADVAAPNPGKNLYSEIANPGFIPLPAFNPYAMMYQQQPKIYNGWSYFYGHPSPIAPAVAPYGKQFDEYEEFEQDFGDVVKQGTPPAPSPAAQCGKGPLTMPAARSSVEGKINYPATYTTATAKKGAWPFMVALKKTGEDTSFCAGTLISDTKVLLAAQCLEKFSVYDMSTVTLLIGGFKSDLSDAQMTRRISKVVIHSKYNAATYANDIACIVMDSPVVLSKTVFPVCLPAASTDPDQYADQNAVILGWDSQATPAGASLEQALVSISANTECKTESFGQFVSDLTICVTSADKFTCPNDVGGPVVIGVPPALPATSPVTWTLVGINSYTKDCASNSLKTRVAAFRDWIDKAY